MNTLTLCKRIGAAICVLALAACSSEPLRLGSQGSAPPPGSDVRPLFASACGFQLLLVIPIQNTNRHQRAYSMLAAQAGDAYITNVKIKESWTWAFIGTSYCTEMSADAVVRVPGAAASARALAPPPPPETTPAPASATAVTPAPSYPLAPPPPPGPTAAVGTVLRMQPKAQSPGLVAVPAGTPLAIKGDISNGEGRWYYATVSGKSGWLAETEVKQP